MLFRVVYPIFCKVGSLGLIFLQIFHYSRLFVFATECNNLELSKTFDIIFHQSSLFQVVLQIFFNIQYKYFDSNFLNLSFFATDVDILLICGRMLLFLFFSLIELRRGPSSPPSDSDTSIGGR